MKFKVSSDLFIGSQELNRLIQSLDEKGFRSLFLNDSIEFGLFNNSINGNWDNFLVSQGTNVGTLRVKDGIAVDSTGQIILWPDTNNIALTDDNIWKWIKISHQYDVRELGTVTIDANGNLTGVGTEFLSSLRGLPNNPTRVAFVGSTINIQEYDLVEVVDDANAILAGNFAYETGLRLKVVGSFTPGIVIPTDSKNPFQYDGCLMTLVNESVLNTAPAITAGQEFLIARIKRNGGTVTIQDKRSLNTYKSKSDYSLNNAITSTNPLIGIEVVKFNNNLTPREENLIYLSWAFRSSNFTTDSSTNRVTLISGLGGKFKSTSDFTDGQFDGWRLYTKDGKYSIIKQSSLVSTQINLVLDHLDPDRFVDSTQQLIVTPNVEEIELIFAANSTDTTDLLNKRVTYPINNGQVIVPLVVYKNPFCLYNVKYRYKNFKAFSQETAIPTDTVNGYLIESDFDVNGVQIASVRQTYTSDNALGFITLNLASNAYTNRIGSIETGDLFGISYVELNNSSPVRHLNVGLDKQVEIFRTVSLGSGGLGNPYTLSVDQYIDLRTDPTGIKNGNSFILQFKGDYVQGAFNIIITQDYVNSGSTGTHLYTFFASDVFFSASGILSFNCKFDGANWIVQRIVDVYKYSTFATTGDLDDIDLGGFYDINDSDVNKPTTYGGLLKSEVSVNNDIRYQTFVSYAENRFFFRRKPPSSAWQSWVELASEADVVLKAGSTMTGALVNTVTGEFQGGVRTQSSGAYLKTKVIQIGDWNMDTGASVNVAHGLSDITKIRNVDITIIRDDSAFVYKLETFDNSSETVQGGVLQIGGTNITLYRKTGGVPFDSVNFDATSFNRGFITITYEA